MRRRYLSPTQVAELAELLEDAPRRVGIVDQVLEAAAAGRGLTLLVQPAGATARYASEPRAPGPPR